MMKDEQQNQIAALQMNRDLFMAHNHGIILFNKLIQMQNLFRTRNVLKS